MNNEELIDALNNKKEEAITYQEFDLASKFRELVDYLKKRKRKSFEQAFVVLLSNAANNLSDSEYSVFLNTIRDSIGEKK